MKNKKGFIFGVLGLFYLLAGLIILGLLIWGGFKLSSYISSGLDWVKTYWWAVLIGLGLLLFYKQATAILNFILSKLGIKVR